MTRPTGNSRLKAARVAAGYNSQQALADAMSDAAPRLGIRGMRVGVRQVRRWESADPPWPQPDYQRVLKHVLGQEIEDLGFTAPWDEEESDGQPTRRHPIAGTAAAAGLATVPTQAVASQPASVGTDYAAVTRSHRRLYWTVAPATLHPAVLEHARLGCALLPETTNSCHETVASALAESYLLAGRIEFFDLREPEQANHTLLRALQAAGEADDALLGSAILAHTAFIPGWSGDQEAARERMVAARTYARRNPAASAEFWAWLDAVEAECETRSGDTRTALHLIRHAEDVLARGSDHASPAWMDWFNPVRLAAFKGNTQLKAGHLPQARSTLLRALDELPHGSEKQRTVILGDLAAVEAADGRPQEACEFAFQALEQLAVTWYAVGMDRVRDVRRALQPWQNQRCVRELDDRLYGWTTTVSALSR
jgi:hypothetical protein